MTGQRYYRFLASILSGLVALVALSTTQVWAAQPVNSVTPNVEELENNYWQHSMHRNEIAAQLNDLWRQEKTLQVQYEVAGRSDEQVDFYQLARGLKQTRQQIDSLRSLLRDENQVIARIGTLIPD